METIFIAAIYALIFALNLTTGIDYTNTAGTLATETQISECRATAATAPNAPTRADSFQPGGMERTVIRQQQLVDDCMKGNGFTRKA